MPVPKSKLIKLISRIPVLVYHKITARRELGINTLSPDRFHAHIRYLNDLGYRTVTFKDLLSDCSLPEKPVIISFDDGYQCIIRNALPVLQSYGYRAVVFIVAGFVGRRNRWDVNLGGKGFRHLTGAEIKLLAQAGWEVASHGMTHRPFSYLNAIQLKQELKDSRQALEDIIQSPVFSLAYPFGLLNQRVQDCASRAGYVFGCRNISPVNGKPHLMGIQRIPVYQFENSLALARKMRAPGIPSLEKWKLTALRWLAVFTPIYQKLFKPELFLEN